MQNLSKKGSDFASHAALGNMKTKRQRRESQSAPSDAAADLGTPLQKTGDPPHNETLVALHRARFLDWSPTAATASAVSGDGSLLAVARESGDVELWQTDHWTCITVAPLLVQGLTVCSSVRSPFRGSCLRRGGEEPMQS